MDVTFDHTRKFDPAAYQIPQGFPELLEAYVKEVTRFNPSDIVQFSTEYFAALSENNVEAFLDAWRQEQPYVPARLQEPEVEHVSQSDRDYFTQTQKIRGVNAIPIRQNLRNQQQQQQQQQQDEEDATTPRSPSSPALSSSSPHPLDGATDGHISQPSRSSMQYLAIDRNLDENESLRRGSFQGRAREPAIDPSIVTPPVDHKARKRDIFYNAFRQYDPEGAGCMDSTHMANLLNDLGWDANEEELQEAIEALDRNSDGSIDFGEFLQWSEYAWQTRVDSGIESLPVPSPGLGRRKSSARRRSSFVPTMEDTKEDPVAEETEAIDE